MDIEKMILSKATAKNKKYKATFYRSNGTKKSISFGDNRYEDFTMHKDKQRKLKYQSRHKSDNITNPMSAGALSYYILWSKPSLRGGVKTYSDKFNIKVNIKL